MWPPIFIFLFLSLIDGPLNDFIDISVRPLASIIPAIDVGKLKEEWFDKYAVYFSRVKRWNRSKKYREACHLLKN